VRWQRKSERSEISRSGGILCGINAKNVDYHSLTPFVPEGKAIGENGEEQNKKPDPFIHYSKPNLHFAKVQ